MISVKVLIIWNYEKLSSVPVSDNEVDEAETLCCWCSLHYAICHACVNLPSFPSWTLYHKSIINRSYIIIESLTSYRELNRSFVSQWKWVVGVKRQRRGHPHELGASIPAPYFHGVSLRNRGGCSPMGPLDNHLWILYTTTLSSRFSENKSSLQPV